MKKLWLLAATAWMLAAVAASLHDKCADPECVAAQALADSLDCGASDTCAFLACSKELGRPCTDEDVFGPPEQCEDIHPDDPESC